MVLIFLPILITVELLELIQAAIAISAAVATTLTVGELILVRNLTITTLEKKTIEAWLHNGLDETEKSILLENGYSETSCFTLEELKIKSNLLLTEKAPGKPTEADGFIEDPKAKDKLVKNPNGLGKGWLDKKGDVWVPTGSGDIAHGGPHWDVQYPRIRDGELYRNVYPGGKIHD